MRSVPLAPHQTGFAHPASRPSSGSTSDSLPAGCTPRLRDPEWPPARGCQHRRRQRPPRPRLPADPGRETLADADAAAGRRFAADAAAEESQDAATAAAAAAAGEAGGAGCGGGPKGTAKAANWLDMDHATGN